MDYILGMIEYGLEECLDTRPSSLTSPTLTIRSAGSGLEEFLEVHYHSAHVEEGEEVDAQVELIDKEKSQTNMPESCSVSTACILIYFSHYHVATFCLYYT